VNAADLLHTFQLHDERVLNKKVYSVSKVQANFLVLDRKGPICRLQELLAALPR
jgi:hypothetical protein